LRFGLQDTKGEVHSGTARANAVLQFDLTLDVKQAEPPDFRGSFVHGARGARFLYLSWKRPRAHTHPWGWRIKIPLSGIGTPLLRAAEAPDTCLAANVIGRRPHASAPIAWCVEPLSEGPFNPT
jgi:hypothetical protein